MYKPICLKGDIQRKRNKVAFFSYDSDIMKRTTATMMLLGAGLGATQE